MNVLSRLGDVLVERGWISPEALQEGLDAQAENGERLGQILVQKKKITEQELLNALALQFAIEVIENAVAGEDAPVLHLRLDLVVEVLHVVLDPLGLPSCVRVSMCHYNSEREVAAFLTAMAEIAE